MDKTATASFNIHTILKERWSPRAFTPQAVDAEKINRMLEAARWSPSSSNEQPWRFVVGMNNDETYKKIFDTLVEFNQLWAKTAPVLMLAIGNTRSLKDPSKPNNIFKYDVGQAVAHLTFQATADGLYVHQMGGFDTKKAAEAFSVPSEFEVLTAIAVGYIGDPEVLHPNLKKMEYNERERQALGKMVFAGKFGDSLV
jgi:nitroreductase